MKIRSRFLSLVALVVGAMVAVPAALAIHSRFPGPSADFASAEPVQSGPEVKVASGSYKGVSWTLSAVSTDQGLCLNLDISPTANVVGGSCGFGLEGETGGPLVEPPSNGKIGYARDCFIPQGVGFIYGPVAPDVDSVSIVLADTAPVLVNDLVQSAPPPPMAAFQYYIAPTDKCPDVSSVVALDSNGVPLGSLQPLNVQEATSGE